MNTNSDKKLDFEIKRIEMMLAKIEKQSTVCKVSVLSASIESAGFWFQESEIQSEILQAALIQQLLNLRKKKRAGQKIVKA
jgi:hypothetical protein